MKYHRLFLFTFYFSTACVLLNYASAEPRSAGRLAAKLDYCGHYIESNAISDAYYGFKRFSLFIDGKFYTDKKSASWTPWVNFQREYHQNEIGEDGEDPETGLEVDCGNLQNATREALHWALTRQDWIALGGSYKLKWSVEKINRQGNLGVKYFPVNVSGPADKNRNNENAANNLHLLGKQTLCKVALKTNGILWDLSSDYFIQNVNEAKSRGLSEQDCARILGRTTAVASSSFKASKITNENDRSICKFALTGTGTIWETLSYFQDYVNEAKSRGLSEQDCARELGRTYNIATSSTMNSTNSLIKRSSKTTFDRARGLEGVSERRICKNSLTGNGIHWDGHPYFRIYVREAKRRGLTEQDCAGILGRKTTVASSSSSLSLKNQTNDEICNEALTINGTIWDDKNAYFRLRVEEAKSRGLSEQDCARILGRSVAVAVPSAVPSILVSSDISSENDKDVCKYALDGIGVVWENSNYLQSYVREAKSRGLSEQDCAQVLGRTNTVVPKPDPKPSYALIKRTQEALKSLGLYRGKIDGVIGVQSRSALKQWQKRNGFADTGKIEEAQIVKLETDALEAIAKREEERKEKAKRLAEANKIKNPDAIAVIIGNRDYKGSTPDVDFAANDADAMKKYVLNKLGYRPGNVIDLRDASKAQLEDAFGTKENHKGRLYDYVRADESDVIVFYSGHGVPGMSDKRGYLLAVDANPNRAELTGYPVDVFLKNLAKVPAKSMMVFIDACFSGDSPKGMLVRATSGLTVKITAPKKVSDNMIVITAAEGDQFASWDEDAKHGLFTKHLLEALNGAADKHAKTGNKDGKVTLGEVKAYLDREMTYQARRRFSRDQHATVSGDLKTVLSAY